MTSRKKEEQQRTISEPKGVKSGHWWDNDAPEELLSVGELFPDGLVRPIRGVLSLAMMAKQEGLRGVVVPAPNAQGAAVVDEFKVHHVAGLSAVHGD